MAKISKNIKKLRTERKLTQDTLAEKINVTRQTISSWETDRTQPDIEMLELLSSFFDVSIEELIYGEKRNVGLEAKQTNSRKLIGIIFAVIGSLFVVAGLAILFINFWLDIPIAVQTFFSFIPLALGASFALFTYEKKQGSFIFTEASSCAWCIGFAVTLALINYVYSVDMGFNNLLVIDAVFVLMTAMLTDSVVAKLSYFVLTVIWLFKDAVNANGSLKIFLYLVLTVVGCVCVFIDRKNDLRKAIPVWAAIASSSVGLVAVFEHLRIIHDGFFTACVILIPSVFAALYAADTGERKYYPFRYPAVFSIAAVTTTISVMDMLQMFEYSGFFDIDYIAQITASAILIGVGVFFGKKSFKSNILKILFTVFSFLFAITAPFPVVPIVLTVATDLLLIIYGAKKAKILTANLGLISICILMITIVFGISINPIAKGVVCVIIGAILITVNIIMSKSFSLKRRGSDENA